MNGNILMLHNKETKNNENISGLDFYVNVFVCDQFSVVRRSIIRYKKTHRKDCKCYEKALYMHCFTQVHLGIRKSCRPCHNGTRNISIAVLQAQQYVQYVRNVKSYYIKRVKRFGIN